MRQKRKRTAFDVPPIEYPEIDFSFLDVAFKLDPEIQAVIDRNWKEFDEALKEYEQQAKG